MKQPVINIEAKPDWETFYDPKLVGKYLLEHSKKNQGYMVSKSVSVSPIHQPEPSLHDFLKWVAKKK